MTQSPARDEKMDVGMEAEHLVPGVQHGEHAWRGVQASGSDLEQGLGGGGEENGKRLTSRAEEEGVQHQRHGEDEVEVRHGQQVGLLALKPALLGQRLTIGAVAVAAGVVDLAHVAAVVARFASPAEQGCAAGDQVAHDAGGVGGQAAGA